jgi:hypothetical protein
LDRPPGTATCKGKGSGSTESRALKSIARTPAIPERESFEGAEPAFDVWLVTVTMTKFRLPPTTMHAEIARGWNTIFGALKSDPDPKRQFAPNKVLVLYC